MAEALFEDGPLEQYLRDAREVLVESSQSMPGTSSQIGDEIASASGLDWEQPLRLFRRRQRRAQRDEAGLERHDHDAEEDEEDEEVVEGYTEEELEAMEWRPKLLIVGLDLLESFLSSTRPPPTLSPFVEKFKYIVISSSLLSTTLSSSTSTSTSLVSNHFAAQHKQTSSEDAIIPGKLALPPPTLHVHHPSSTAESPTSPSSRSSQTTSGEPLPPYAYLSLAALVASVLLSLERRWLATLSLGGLSYLAYNLFVGTHEETSSYDFTPTINALDDLIEANKTWETIVQDSLQYLEREEASLSSTTSHPRSSSKTHMTSPSYYHHPRSSTSSYSNNFTSPTSTKTHHLSPSYSSSSRTPSSALRIALNSTLQTTRNQCENVRQLFSALTCPSELAQLSVMYAPPSPGVKSPLLLPAETSSSSSFGVSGGGLASPRPYSFPPRSSPSSPDATLNKRSTWSGGPNATSYTSLAGLGSPTTPFRRRDRMSLYQRTGVPTTNLGALFENGSPTPSTGSVNTPVTPFQSLHLGGTGAQSLAQIAEDLHGGFERERERGGAGVFGEDEGQVLEFPSHLSSNPSVVGQDEEEDEELFGSVALGLQKKRKADGMGVFSANSGGLERAFELSSPPHHPLGYNDHAKSPGSLFSSNSTLLRSPPGAGRQYPLSPHQQKSSHQRLSTFTSSSRFTSIQPPKHPLSLYAIHQALQAALLSRRYTCSHLLALRFTEEASLSSSTSSTLTVDPADREEYWENVKSVVELLTTTFEGEASRLAEALEDVERQWGLDEIPTPNASGEFSAVNGGDPRRRKRRSGLGAAFEEDDQAEEEVEGEQEGEREQRSKRGRTSYERISFAPMPSHLSRFAAHVAAISGALEDAREQLEEVVATLKADAATAGQGHSTSSAQACHSKKKSSLCISVFPHANQAMYGQADGAPLGDEERGEESEHKALQAYERLRRELGLALRECERGRQRLTEIVHPPALTSSSDEDEEGEGVPQLSHDTSDDSDKPEPLEDESALPNSSRDGEIQVELVTDPVDRASVNDLLLQRQPTLEQELAVDGVEQVYEADTGLVGDFSRERSKLSREERIQAVKAQREKAASRQSMRLESLASSSPSTGGGGDFGSYTGKLEKWGPGGEVVQELKDVIWQVGEKRRKKMEQVQAQMGAERDLPVAVETGRGQEVKGLEVVQEEDSSSSLPYL